MLRCRYQGIYCTVVDFITQKQYRCMYIYPDTHVFKFQSCVLALRQNDDDNNTTGFQCKCDTGEVVFISAAWAPCAWWCPLSKILSNTIEAEIQVLSQKLVLFRCYARPFVTLKSVADP
jgi:hypothetical protein